MKNPTPNRYRNDRPPYRKGVIPVAKTVDAALSYIAKLRTFTAPKLLWTDMDPSGVILRATEYGVTGSHYAPQGVRKFYVIREWEDPSKEDNDDGEHLISRWRRQDPTPLFVYDIKHDQWYRNAMRDAETDAHPLYPCVTPDKSIIALPDNQLRYLIAHDIMGLMEAKLEGRFKDHWTKTFWTTIDLENSLSKWLEWSTTNRTK